MHRHGEPPCVHHAFTHAEGLVKALKWAESHGKTDCEYHKKKGTVYIPEADTYIVNENGWRVTVTGNDSGEKEYCAPSGGAVSLLYHDKTGPLLVSSMTRFIRYEIMNTQRHMKCDDLPFTVRLQKGGEPVCYSNNLDKCAVIKQVSGNTFEANGKICGVKGENPPDGAVNFKSRYVFETDRAVFTYEHSGENIDLIFPAVIKNDEPVTVKDGKTVMIKNGTKIKIDFEGAVPEITRFFNHVPGFEGCELKITNVPQRITVTVELIFFICSERTEKYDNIKRTVLTRQPFYIFFYRAYLFQRNKIIAFKNPEIFGKPFVQRVRLITELIFHRFPDFGNVFIAV